ncbi:hypothetical protein DRQ25_11640, partial [Candidatus Fermentibacteria bacterium]
MPRNLSDYQSKLFRDQEDRETRHIDLDGKFILQSDSGLGTARDMSSRHLYTGRGDNTARSIHGKFYTNFKGQRRSNIIHEFDTA